MSNIPRFLRCPNCGTDDTSVETTRTRQHYAVDKETGLTSYIERFNNILRQRLSRLVQRTLSFSKKLDNHIGAICNVITRMNLL